MRIGIEAQRLFRTHKHGMDVVALELIRALQQLDTVNDYFVFVRPDVDSACLQLGANFTLVPITGLNYIHWEQVALPRCIRQYQLDVLHCTASTAPWFTTVPLVLTLHDVLFLNRHTGINTATLYQRLGNRYRSWLVPRLAERCGRVLTVSAYAGREIRRELRRPELPLEVLHNGVSKRFQPSTDPDTRARIRQRYALPARYLFFLGSADPRKNLRGVLKAFAAYAQTDPDCQLIVSGEVPPMLAQLITPAERAVLDRRCRFVGYIADADLPGVYSLAETFLFPSISEGFGLPVLEAMGCGTPVITSAATAMPEVAGNAALLVDPLDQASIVAALQRLRLDADLRQQLIGRGFDRARQFTWERAARQLLAVYGAYDTQTRTPSDLDPIPASF